MEINIEKPDYPLRTPYKFVAGMMSLVFGGLSAFVFVVERNRGLAMMVFIPTAICFIWYMYLLYKDNISLSKYKKYATNLHELLKTKDIKYIIDAHLYGEAKGIISVLIMIFLVISIAFTIEKVRYVSGTAVFLVFLLLGGYAILDYLEREEVESNILEMETRLAVMP